MPYHLFRGVVTTPCSINQPKRPDPRRIANRVLLQIVPHIPYRPVVRRVDGRLGVVLPTHAVLRSLAFREYGLFEGQLPRWIARQPPGEPLAGEVRASPERVADTDVAVPVHRRAGHPAEKPIRR